MPEDSLMTDTPTLPAHVRENRAYWDGCADDWVEAGEQAWRTTEPVWGCWQLPESDLQLLPERMDGMDAIELGCGTGYVSAWMARRGARFHEILARYYPGTEISGETP